MKIRQLEAWLAQRGWTYHPRMGTTVRHWRHRNDELITFCGNSADECDPGQLAAVLTQLGLTAQDLPADPSPSPAAAP